MFERYSDPAQNVVASAGEEARNLGHHHIGTEHLLLGLLSDAHNPATDALPTGTTVQVVRRKVAEAVGDGGPTTDDDLTFTPRAKRALERASRFSLQRHTREVEIVHVLLGVLDVEGRAGQVLRGLGVDVGRLREAAERAAEREAEREADQTKPQPRLRRATPVRAGVVAGTDQLAIDLPQEERSVPRCNGCGADLHDTLACDVIAVSVEGDGSRRFAVAYCSSCGVSLSATPA